MSFERQSLACFCILFRPRGDSRRRLTPSHRRITCRSPLTHHFGREGIYQSTSITEPQRVNCRRGRSENPWALRLLSHTPDGWFPGSAAPASSWLFASVPTTPDIHPRTDAAAVETATWSTGSRSRRSCRRVGIQAFMRRTTPGRVVSCLAVQRKRRYR